MTHRNGHPPALRLLAGLAALALLLLGILACARSPQGDGPAFWSVSVPGTATPPSQAAIIPEPIWSFGPRRTPGGPVFTPTPDNPHNLPPLRTTPDVYTIQAGDTLGLVASKYGVSVEQIVTYNDLADANLLSVGQVINIPVPTPEAPGPSFKIIPDSELVNGPVNVLFKVDEFVQKQGGFLASYKEEVGERSLSGAQIVQQIAQDYSVNPRLLLAVLEYQSGWVTKKTPAQEQRSYPLGLLDPQRKGLYRQLAWAANSLNRGFYLWQAGGVGVWLMSDGTIIPINPTINAGTAAVQQFFAPLLGRKDWEQAVSQTGLAATFTALFGYPFDYAVEPLLPAGLQQPPLQLPFEPGVTWAFTGGPHGGWGDGSAWGALDFGPPGKALGCVLSDAWVVAIADGPVIRTGDGAVIQDLDGDGMEQTGWVILYMHIDSNERVAAGTLLKAGDRVGHPSCEGGVSNGTHVHIARRYNGAWIPADSGSLPFVMDGWVASGAGREYDGYLERNGKTIEAYAGNSPDNGIQR